MPPSRTPTVAVADRVLHVLAVLAQQRRMLTVPELMELTGLARSTLYRQLARLRHWGFVIENDGGYAPGPLGLQLALGFDLASHLVRLARPDMVALARQSRESAALLVAVNGEAVCLEMVDSEQALRCSFEKGRSVPLRAGASAKCLLAHLPEAEREAVLEAQFEAAERDAARAELDAIRAAGVATSAGEVDAGIWGVSMPLLGPGRQALGALTLMAPLSRALGQEPSFTRLTGVAAARISRALSQPS